MGKRRITKRLAEQLDLVERELQSFGITEYTLVEKWKHCQVRWSGRRGVPGGSVGLAGTGSDKMGLMALRASVRKQCKGTAG